MATPEDKANLERFFSICPDPLGLLDSGGVFLQVSGAWERTLGLGAAELLGRSFLEFVHPDDVSAVQAQLARLREENTPLGLETRWRSRSGRFVWLAWSLLSVPDEGRIYAWARNVGKQKRLERALLQRIETKMLVASISSHFVNVQLEGLDQGLQAALAELGKTVRADRCSLFMLSDDGRRFINTHEWRAEGVPSVLAQRVVVSRERFPWLTERLFKLDVVDVPRVVDLPDEAGDERRVFMEQGVESFVRVPAAYAGRLVGFVGVDAVRPGQSWDRSLRAFLQVLGEMFAVTMERRRVEESLREVASQRDSMREVIEEQESALETLSTPIIQVWDSVLVLPLVGNIDRARAAEITEKLLHAIVETKSHYAIIEITGVEEVDASTAQHVLTMMQTIELLGAQGVVAGVQPQVAEMASSLGLELTSIQVYRDLQEALRWCIRQLRAAPSRRKRHSRR